MSDLIEKYFELIRELRIARLECDQLLQEIEVEYISELDSLWEQMTDEEQEMVELKINSIDSDI